MLPVKAYLLVPVIAAIVMVYFRTELHAELIAVVSRYPLRQIPPPLGLDGILVVLALLAEVIYALLSSVLSIVLGTFPPLNWPLPPLRPLIVKTRRIRPVVVRMAVPPLPKRWLWV